MTTPPADPVRVDGDWPFTFEYAHACATHARRDAIRRAGLTDDELARRAAEYGIAPRERSARWADDLWRQRIAELVSVYGDWRAMAINAHAWRVSDARYAAGERPPQWRPDVVDFRGWPGDIAADYDTSAERFNLSPSGPWQGDDLPLIYALALGSNR